MSTLYKFVSKIIPLVEKVLHTFQLAFHAISSSEAFCHSSKTGSTDAAITLTKNRAQSVKLKCSYDYMNTIRNISTDMNVPAGTLKMFLISLDLPL